MSSHITTHGSDVYQLVTFVLGGEEFGADILTVREIIRPTAFTCLPQAPASVEGIINLRDRVVPVVDLRKQFGFAAKERDRAARIIVVELDDRVVGFLVDEVREVIRIEMSVTEPPPDLATSIDAAYITGLAKLDDRMVILLDLNAVLTPSEHEALPR